MSICIEHSNFESTYIHTQNNVSQNLSACERPLQIPLVGFSKWNLLKQIKIWMSRSRQRRDLAALDKRLLADIGYTATQAREEFTKPFWK